MPWWYYDKKELRNTPSAKDNIDYDVESQYREEGARFIINTGKEMELGCTTVATGVTYYHRFYMVHSFVTFPRYLTACTALFVAGKVEETPKKARDIVKMAEKNLPPAEFAKFGEYPKEEMLVLERILLQSIKFDVHVEHPYEFLMKYAKFISHNANSSSAKEKMEEVLQMAWIFVNDSFYTTLCLQWEPEIIAVAMLYLAAKLSKYDIDNCIKKSTSRTKWWELFVNGVTTDFLEDICHQVLDSLDEKPLPKNDICHQVLDVYSHKKNVSAPSSTQQKDTVQATSAPSQIRVASPPKPLLSVPKTVPLLPPPPPPTKLLTPLVSTPQVLPSLMNPIPNVANPTTMYLPTNAMAPLPPPPVFSVPPSSIPTNTYGYDGNAQAPYGYMYNRY